MTAVFADTFYWIALAYLADSAHQQALTLTAERIDSLIVTTDEVLAEFLTFFATAPEQMRRKAVSNAQRILENPGVRFQSRDRRAPAFIGGSSQQNAVRNSPWSRAAASPNHIDPIISRDATSQARHGTHASAMV
jgi:hypothetical protein